MHPNRLLVLLGGCLLAGSAAMADDLGSVDCASHPDPTPVYAKARKSQDIVANVPCGEKFKVVLFGFIFSQIQTSDGKVGFVFSNLVTIDRAGGTLQTRAASDAAPRLSAASETTKVPADPKPYSAPAQPKRAPASASEIADKMGGSASVAAQPAANPAPAQDVAAAASPNPVPASTSAASAPQPTPAQPQSTQPAPAAVPAPAPSLPDSAAVLKATGSANAEAAPNPVPAPSTPATPVETPTAPANPAPADNAAPASAPADQPAASTEPQPASAEPAPAPVISGKGKTESWERPNQGARSLPLVELFGGFAVARADGGGVYNNLYGGVGSFAWNAKSWIQIAGDSSYSVTTISGAKNVLWGNHYGARYFFRGRFPFHVTPFAEGLVGGSRADVTVSGATTSQNCLSYKIGGGLDMHSPHIRMFEVRLIDFDYYRTAFGTNLHQNNYWISTGIVLRLFGGRAD